MKKLLLASILLFNIVSFGQKTDVKTSMKQSILKYNKDHLKDPSSYQLMNLTILSTETLGDLSSELLKTIPTQINNIEAEIEKNNSVILNHKEEIKKLNEQGGKEVEIEDALETIRVYEADNIKMNKEKKKWELSIIETQKSLQNKHIVSYIVEHRYRAKNSYGALDIQTDIIKFDNNFKIKALKQQD